MKEITLEKRGCDFFANDPINQASDIGNYRVGIYDYLIQGKDGKMYIVEFTHGKHRNYRTTNKRTGKPLKKAIVEITNNNALFIDTQYEKEETDSRTGRTWKSCWRNCKLEEELYKLDLDFTIEGIETALEYITGEKYKVTIEA